MSVPNSSMDNSRFAPSEEATLEQKAAGNVQNELAGVLKRGFENDKAFVLVGIVHARRLQSQSFRKKCWRFLPASSACCPESVCGACEDEVVIGMSQSRWARVRTPPYASLWNKRARTSPKRPVTDGSLSPSVPMENSMCRWERPAIFASPIPIAMRSSAGSIRTGADTRSLRVGSETQSVSIGTRTPMTYGSPTMEGIISATINRRTNSTMRRHPGCTSAIPIAMGERSRILSTVGNVLAENLRKLPPHWSLRRSPGMRFYTGTMFPKEYRNQIFIAEHGSWNRSEKIGYRITLVSRDEQGRTRYSVFAAGWLQGQRAWGRPADVLVMPDGALLVSDDSAGAIYRIAYSEP